MKVYIAGPMRGYKFFNFDEFFRVARIVRELGHTPVNPAELSQSAVIERGLDPADETSYGAPHFQIEDFMETDVRALRDVECIVLLAGWTASKGVAVEIAYARYRGIPVYGSIDEFELLVCQRQQAA